MATARAHYGVTDSRGATYTRIAAVYVRGDPLTIAQTGILFLQRSDDLLQWARNWA
ncbi:MAG: hypothetical protein ABL909_08795 [Sphingopyxis sp.]